jgi:hypothetical protein
METILSLGLTGPDCVRPFDEVIMRLGDRGDYPRNAANGFALSAKMGVQG